MSRHFVRLLGLWFFLACSGKNSISKKIEAYYDSDEIREFTEVQHSLNDNLDEYSLLAHQIVADVLNEIKIKGYTDLILRNGGSTTISHLLQPYTLSTSLRDSITTKKTLYLEESAILTQENQGFSEGCDSLLFTSLRRVGGADVDLTLAEGAGTGQMYRSPTHDCYPNNSQSTISRDMLNGLAWALWQEQNQGYTQGLTGRVWEYAKANNWYTGEAIDIQTRQSRASFSIDLGILYQSILYQLTGTESQVRKLPVLPASNVIGFEAHLLVLFTFLSGYIHGGLSEPEYKSIQTQAARQPKNAFFQAALHAFTDGVMDGPAESLMDETWFPNDKLPSNLQRCENYIWQRDDGTDWQPCSKEQSHDGSDFLFLAAIVLDEVKRK